SPVFALVPERVEVIVADLQLVVLDEVVLEVVVVLELVLVEVVLVELLVILELVVSDRLHVLIAEDIELFVAVALLALHVPPRESGAPRRTCTRPGTGSCATIRCTFRRSVASCDSRTLPEESTRSIRSTPGGSMENDLA